MNIGTKIKELRKQRGITQEQLANSIGIIDEAYKGENDEWNFLAYATRNTLIRKNERICQFRLIEHQPGVVFIEVQKLDNADRGGIGSTGR